MIQLKFSFVLFTTSYSLKFNKSFNFSIFKQIPHYDLNADEWMTEKYQVQTVDNYTVTIVLIAANLWEKSNISTVEEHNWEDLVWIHNTVNLYL